jgi:hypothetical protein
MEPDKLLEEHLISPFTEEYYGDLHKAWDDITRLQNVQDSPKATASFFESCIWFWVLTGRLSEAYKILEEYRTFIEGPGSRWRLQYAIQKSLVDYYRRYPPSMRFQHDWLIPVNLPILDNITGPIDISKELDQNVEMCSGPEFGHDRKGYQMFQIILWFPERLRNMTILNPLYPFAEEDLRSPEQIIAEKVPQLVQFKGVYCC